MDRAPQGGIEKRESVAGSVRSRPDAAIHANSKSGSFVNRCNIPGAVSLPSRRIALRSHKDRPTNSYALQGSANFHPEGKADRVMQPGEGLAEGCATGA